MLIAGTLLVVLGAAVLLFMGGVRQAPPLLHRLVFTAVMALPVLTLSAVVHSGRSHLPVYQFQLTGYRLSWPAAPATWTLGGSQDADAVYMRGFPAGGLSVSQPPGATGSSLQATVHSDQVILRVEDEHGQRRWVNAVPLAPGQSIHLENGSGDVLDVDYKGGRKRIFRSGDTRLEMRGERALMLENLVHGRDPIGSEPTFESICIRWPGEDDHLLLLPRDHVVLVDGARAVAPVDIALASDDAGGLPPLQIRYVEEFTWPVRLYRDVRLSAGTGLGLAHLDGELSVDFHRPVMETVRARDLEEALEPADEVLGVHVTAKPLAGDRCSMTFGRHGRVFDGIRSRLYLAGPRLDRLGIGNGFAEMSGAGPRLYSFGESVRLGESPAWVARIVRIDSPWFLVLAMLSRLAILALVLPSRMLYRRGWLAGVMACVDLVLVLRLLFAFKAMALYPADAEVLPLALTACAVIPQTILAAWWLTCLLEGRGSAVNRERAEVWASQWLLVVWGGVVVRPYGHSAWLLVAVVPLGLVALDLALGLWGRERVRAARERLYAALDDERTLWWSLWIVALGAVILRSGAALIGWKEAVHLGGVRFALSILGTPTMLVVGALAFLLLIKQPHSEGFPGRWFRAVLPVGIVVGLTGLFVADYGVWYVNGLPLVVMLLGVTWWHLRLARSTGALSWLGNRLPYLVLLTVLLIPTLGGAALSVWDRLDGDGRAMFAERVRSRLVLAADPSRLEDEGLRKTEEVAPLPVVPPAQVPAVGRLARR